MGYYKGGRVASLLYNPYNLPVLPEVKLGTLDSTGALQCYTAPQLDTSETGWA